MQCERCYTVLYSASKQAVGWGLLVRKPTDYVSVARPERREMRPLSHEQVQAVIDRTADHRLHAL